MVYIPIDIDSSLRKECNRRRYSKKTAGLSANIVEELKWKEGQEHIRS